MSALSVVMPVYNGEKYLKEAIESVLNQTFGDFEFIIINDGSTDKTEEIVKEFAQKDERIVYEKNEKNMGVSYNLNKGMGLAKGKYIARMDADDICGVERFEKQFEYMENNPNCGALGSNYIAFNEETGEEITIVKPESDREIKLCGLYEREFCHSAVMLRKDAFKEHNLEYNSEYDGAEDFELWQRAKHFMEFHNLQEFLMRSRMNDKNLSEQQKNKRSLLANKISEAALKEIIEEDFYVPLFTKLSFTLPELKESFNELGEIPLMKLKGNCPFTRKEIAYACNMHADRVLSKINLSNDYLNGNPKDVNLIMDKLLKILDLKKDDLNKNSTVDTDSNLKLNLEDFKTVVKDIVAEEIYIPIYEKPEDTSLLALRESFRVLSEIPLMPLKADCLYTRGDLNTAAYKEKEIILDRIID